MAMYLLENGYQRGAIDTKLFTKHTGPDLILAQVYVDDIIFGSTSESLTTEFAAVMANKFEMSMIRELSFFIVLQVKQSADGISIF